MVKTNFYVNKEKKVVVCRITTDGDVAYRIKKYGILVPYHYVGDAREYYKTFVGIAKCHPEDEFDENFGKKLAEYRASKARQAYVNAELNKFITKTVKNINKICKYGFMREPHNPLIKDE